MEIVNLNRVRKINLVKKRKTDDYVWRKITWFEKFLNKFRKEKLRQRYIADTWFGHETYNSADEFNEKCGDKYWCYLIGEQIYEKPHINIWFGYDDWETRYFDSDKEAKDFFIKLKTYVKENNIPFIDFYSNL